MTLPRNFVILANKIWCGFRIICSIKNYWPEDWRKKGNCQPEIVRNRLKVNKIVSTVVMVGIATLFRQACSFVRLSGSITRLPCQCACLRISGLFCLGAESCLWRRIFPFSSCFCDKALGTRLSLLHPGEYPSISFINSNSCSHDAPCLT